ncbi:MAG: glycosyltransferase [Rhodospirillales bacterium]|nr:glycosyltransferase [Rhodospirillales bacterium]
MQYSGVCVCACTYRRPEGLSAMLEGIGRQTFAAMRRPVLHIVIADNECSERTRDICDEFERRFDIPMSYVPEPRRGISFARNACLDNIPDGFDFFASIDDDEVPDPDWLEKLLEARAATGADVVQGAVVPTFPRGTPKWLVDGNFFGVPRRSWTGTTLHLHEYQELEFAATNNALVRVAAVNGLGLRFDPALALTGGEDSRFFRTLAAAGSRIVYAPRARVSETVPAERATAWYRLKLEFRIGYTRAAQRAERKKRKPVRWLRQRWYDSGPEKVVSGCGLLIRNGVRGQLDKDKALVAGMRIAYGLGQFAHAMGITYTPYR